MQHFTCNARRTGGPRATWHPEDGIAAPGRRGPADGWESSMAFLSYGRHEWNIWECASPKFHVQYFNSQRLLSFIIHLRIFPHENHAFAAFSERTLGKKHLGRSRPFSTSPSAVSGGSRDLKTPWDPQIHSSCCTTFDTLARTSCFSSFWACCGHAIQIKLWPWRIYDCHSSLLGQFKALRLPKEARIQKRSANSETKRVGMHWSPGKDWKSMNGTPVCTCK